MVLPCSYFIFLHAYSVEGRTIRCLGRIKDSAGKLLVFLGTPPYLENTKFIVFSLVYGSAVRLALGLYTFSLFPLCFPAKFPKFVSCLDHIYIYLPFFVVIYLYSFIV